MKKDNNIIKIKGVRIKKDPNSFNVSEIFTDSTFTYICRSEEERETVIQKIINHFKKLRIKRKLK